MDEEVAAILKERVLQSKQLERIADALERLLKYTEMRL